MSQQVMMQVSEQAVRQATTVASQTQRRIEEVLAEWLVTIVNELSVDALVGQ